MLKRIAVVLASIALVVGLAPAANAYYSDNVCDTAHNLGETGSKFTAVVCYQVSYQLQNDGSGIHVNGIYLDINQGCDYLGGFGVSTLKNLFGGTRKNDGTKWKETASPSNMTDCHAFRTLDINGPDNGEAVLDFSMDMNIDNFADPEFGVVCTLHTNGSGDCSLHPDNP